MSSHRTPSSILQQLEMHSQLQHPELHCSRRSHDPRRTKPRGLCWQDRVWLSLACIFLILLLLRIGTAQASSPELAPPQSVLPEWGLSLQAGDVSALHLALDTAIHVEVTGLLARVHVAQSFSNDSNDWVEGTYRFPLPDGAAVDRLFIEVGGRVLEGEIRERDTAQQIYQQAKADGKVASLVRQERANQFQTSLANIGPGERVHVMISFLTNVDYRDGAFRLNLPNTFTPRYGNEVQTATGLPAPRPRLASITSTASHGFSLQVDLAAGYPVSGIESLYHDVDIQAVASGYQVTLLYPDEKTDRAFELQWTPEFGAEPTSSLATWSDGQHVFAQLMLIPPRDSALQAQSREVIFVIDTSGSMQGQSMEQARAALLAGVDALGAGDRFNLIQFNSITEPLFQQALPVTAANLATARRWISKLDADGGTEMAPALRAALRVQPAAGPKQTGKVQPGNAQADLIRQVVFITDGSVGNERELLAEIANLLGSSRLFTVAIGSAPNAGFMRKAAEIGRGHQTHIGRLSDVSQTMTALWTHLRLPAVSDLCIDWGVKAEYYPEILPDLYAGQPLWVTARLAEEPSRVGLCGELNGQPWQHEAWPEPVTGEASLATLWARRKIESLQDSLIFGADPEQMRVQMTRIALDHQLLTPYTSMVAVDHTPVRPGDEALARADVPGLLPAGSANSTAFPATATGWKTQLLLSLLVLAISGGLFLKPYFRLPVFRGRNALLAVRP